MMKTLLTIAIFGIATSSAADTLAVPPFQIEIEDGWVHKIERGSPAAHAWGDLISIYHPNGNGILVIVYDSITESKDIEIDEINEIVKSIVILE